jgi:hypothetical protein
MDSTKNARINAVMALLNSQTTLNYTAAAKAFGIHSTMLMRRYRGKTVSRQEVNSTFR